APPGRPVENVAERVKIRNAASRYAETLQPVEIFIAGAVDQQPLLALEQQSPDRVLVLAVIRPVLRDRVVPNVAHRALRAPWTRCGPDDPSCRYERRRRRSIARPHCPGTRHCEHDEAIFISFR